MEEKWFADRNGQTIGLFTRYQIRMAASEGRLILSDQIWKEGEDARHAVSTCPELVDRVRAYEAGSKKLPPQNGEAQLAANQPPIPSTTAIIARPEEPIPSEESPNEVTTAPEPSVQLSAAQWWSSLQLSAAQWWFWLSSLGSWLFTPVSSLWHFVHRCLVYTATLFGVTLPNSLARYALLFGIYAVIYVIGCQQIRTWPLVALTIGYIGILAVGRAWAQNEKERSDIIKQIADDNVATKPYDKPDDKPDLSGLGLISAVQILFLFPLIFQQVQWHFSLYDVPEGTDFWDWSAFTLDSYNKALLNPFEAYGAHVRVHQIAYDSPWGRHLTTLCRVTFDIVLFRCIHRLIAIYETVRDAVKAVKNDADAPVRVGKRTTLSLVIFISNETDGKDGHARKNAVQALGKLRDPRAVKPLIDVLQNKQNRKELVRRRAAEALGKLGDTRALGPLIAALRDENYMVAQYAAAALGELRDQQAVKPLIEALSYNDPRDKKYTVRQNATVALGELRDQQAVEPLKKLVDDETQPENVLQAAQHALVQIRRSITKQAPNRTAPVTKDTNGQVTEALRRKKAK